MKSTCFVRTLSLCIYLIIALLHSQIVTHLPTNHTHSPSVGSAGSDENTASESREVPPSARSIHRAQEHHGVIFHAAALGATAPARRCVQEPARAGMPRTVAQDRI